MARVLGGDDTGREDESRDDSLMLGYLSFQEKFGARFSSMLLRTAPSTTGQPPAGTRFSQNKVPVPDVAAKKCRLVPTNSGRHTAVPHPA